jgi:hypothetical protein
MGSRTQDVDARASGASRCSKRIADGTLATIRSAADRSRSRRAPQGDLKNATALRDVAASLSTPPHPGRFRQRGIEEVPAASRRLEDRGRPRRSHMAARRSDPRAPVDRLRSEDPTSRPPDGHGAADRMPIDPEIDDLRATARCCKASSAGTSGPRGVRHAKARQITVRAASVRSIGFRLSVADNGRGIPREQRRGGFGMTSMQERANRIGASLTVVTAPRLGTEVVQAWQPSSVPAEGYVVA